METETIWLPPCQVHGLIRELSVHSVHRMNVLDPLTNTMKCLPQPSCTCAIKIVCTLTRTQECRRITSTGAQSVVPIAQTGLHGVV